jgi:SAM-dependent methyltransferase
MSTPSSVSPPLRPAGPPPRRKAADILPEVVDIAGRRVADIGCGEGGFLRAMVAMGASGAVGVECGAEMLACARAHPPVGDERYVEGEGQALPLPDASVDIVVFMNSLHHVPVASMGQALREAARVSAPDGVLLVNEPVAEGDFFQLTRLVDDETEVRAAALAALDAAQAAGVFALRREVLYLNPVRFDDYEAFARRMGLIDGARKRRVAADEATLRARFHELAEPRDGAFYFDQPARLFVLAVPRFPFAEADGNC